MTFRRRIIAAMIPLFALLILLGVTGSILISQLGNEVDNIIHENYDSVVYMRNLNEALERIDSSFQFALAGREKQSRDQYDSNWSSYEKSLDLQQHNVTIHPREDELTARLADLSAAYRKLGDKFFKEAVSERDELYFGKNKDKEEGLLHTFRQIKDVTGDILHLNEQNMLDVDNDTKKLARRSLIWYGGGLACGIVLAAFLMATTIRTIVAPVRAVTESAVAIGSGNLDQVVPYTSDDELGQLAAAFNTMARQLREFRQSHKAQLIRAADEPGDDRLVSRTGAGCRLGTPRGDGQSGGAGTIRFARTQQRRRSIASLGAAGCSSGAFGRGPEGTA